jgi:hypothetical protein
MTSSNAGWYPDPQDARLMRWWDGSGWTDDVYERTEPLGGPLDQHTPFGSGAAATARTTSGASSTGSSTTDPYAPPSGQQSGWAYPPAPSTARPAATAQPSTPDGVPLASWWMRAAARIIDGVIVSLVALLVAFPTAADIVRRA